MDLIFKRVITKPIQKQHYTAMIAEVDCPWNSGMYKFKLYNNSEAANSEFPLREIMPDGTRTYYMHVNQFTHLCGTLHPIAVDALFDYAGSDSHLNSIKPNLFDGFGGTPVIYDAAPLIWRRAAYDWYLEIAKVTDLAVKKELLQLVLLYLGHANQIENNQVYATGAGSFSTAFDFVNTASSEEQLDVTLTTVAAEFAPLLVN